MKIIRYFRDLLATLRSIDARLAKLESLIDSPPYGHSNSHKSYMRTGHWNG